MPTAEQIQQIIEDRVGAAVEVVIVKNAWTVLRQSKFTTGKRRVRVHTIFLEAPEPVLAALADWVARPSKVNNRTIDAFVRSRHDAIRALTPDVEIVTKGKTRDLAEIYLKLESRYFKKPITTKITFGSAGVGRRRRRAIQYGVYDCVKKLIRIHPILDEPWIPRFFVEFIIYHEMLHAELGVGVDNEGRRAHHPPAFRAREREFDYYKEAKDWEERNFSKILKFAGRLAGKD